MHSNGAPRRQYDAEFKARVLAECDEPGASIAAVAQAHSLNANLVHKWRRRRGQQASGVDTPRANDRVVDAFVPLQLPAALAVEVPAIRIELRHGAMTINIAWPGQAADKCAAWLKEWLR